MKHICALIILLSLSFAVTAQSSRFSISPEYSIPLGKLGWTYKAGPGFQVNYSRVSYKKKGKGKSKGKGKGKSRGHMAKAFGLSLTYTTLQPKADTLYYLVDRGGVDGVGMGTAVFSSFKMVKFEGTYDWAFNMNKKVALYIGLKAGGIYGKRDMTFEDSFGAVDGSSEIVTWATVSPLVGVEFLLNKKVSLVPYVSYSLMIQAGTTNPDSIYYNESTGLTYQFFSPGISLNVSF